MGGINYRESALIRKRLGLSLKEWDALINDPICRKLVPKKIRTGAKKKRQKIIMGRVIKISKPNKKVGDVGGE